MKTSRHGGSLLGLITTLLVGGVLGAGLCYLAVNSDSAPARATASVPVEAPAPVMVPESTPSRTPVASAPTAPEVDDYISRKLRQWNLTPEEIKRDLADARDVVREKSRELGDKVKVATADVTIIAKIKAKYTLDDQLSALAIIVDCKEGHVKLSGNVASLDLVGRAIVLALDTDGVIDVVSALKVDVKAEVI